MEEKILTLLLDGQYTLAILVVIIFVIPLVFKLISEIIYFKITNRISSKVTLFELYKMRSEIKDAPSVIQEEFWHAFEIFRGFDIKIINLILQSHMPRSLIWDLRIAYLGLFGINDPIISFEESKRKFVFTKKYQAKWKRVLRYVLIGAVILFCVPVGVSIFKTSPVVGTILVCGGVLYEAS